MIYIYLVDRLTIYNNKKVNFSRSYETGDKL